MLSDGWQSSAPARITVHKVDVANQCGIVQSCVEDIGFAAADQRTAAVRAAELFAWAKHAAIGGAPTALMAHAKESRMLILSRSRRSGVRSSYVTLAANFAMPSAWL